MRTAAELRQSILDRAESDDEFRSRLLAEPKETIADEFDINFPADFDMQVHEDTMTGAHLVLPPNPKLTEDDMSRVSGGGLIPEIY